LKSALQIAHSPGLANLRNDGYDIQVHASNHLLVRSVPYVTADRRIAYGTLIAPLILTPNDVAGPPENHQMYFRGQLPHDAEGNSLAQRLGAQTATYNLAGDLVAQFHFSVKPAVPGWIAYADYHEMVVTYVDLLEKYAQRIDRTVTAKTHRVEDLDAEESVHVYPDTATTRAGIAAAAEKLATSRVAIIGVGGTGSYVLDFLAKTKVREIRLYDGDRFSQHNAYRAPGAAAREVVMADPQPFKVEYPKSVYEKMHLNIVAIPRHVTEVGPEFADIDFTFICIDRAEARLPIIEGLVRLDKALIDVGMGVTMTGTSLGGTLRTTFSAPGHREHRHRIPTTDVPDEYGTNIQIAELNALNAALAVIRWKKQLGFYRAREPEYSSVYMTAFNRIDSADAST
jgi:hypothetical protein